jgi:hypothetical protein
MLVWNSKGINLTYEQNFLAKITYLLTGFLLLYSLMDIYFYLNLLCSRLLPDCWRNGISTDLI